MGNDGSQRNISDNRRARYNYELLEFFQAGLVLTGSEVKSLRLGHAHINEAYASVSRGEVWLIGAHIGAYQNAGYAQHDERRTRKLLLNAAEIEKIKRGLEQKGLTLVPTRLYWHKGRAKVDVALAKGKKTFDKRETIKRREEDRTLRRVMKGVKG
ncbi:MAG: SsrA-binding protein SmpB [Pseudomonadaceae bacterium]|nr:SsrA-binding protein SmpB [Pseudomonadaceae bacterium]